MLFRGVQGCLGVLGVFRGVVQGCGALAIIFDTNRGSGESCRSCPCAGHAICTLHPLRPVSSIAFSQHFSQPLPSCRDSQLWDLSVISIKVAIQPLGVLCCCYQDMVLPRGLWVVSTTNVAETFNFIFAALYDDSCDKSALR